MSVARFRPRPPTASRKPLIGVLCCNEDAERPIQAVASRFIEPLAHISGATVLLVPALPDASDAVELAERLDGLLLTGSRSNVAGHRYGSPCDRSRVDERRDTVALGLSARMIERAKPVFGICRGLQELNVLFGGTLACDVPDHQHRDRSLPYEARFDHEHGVHLAAGGMLATALGATRLRVNSVHEQGVDRLGSDLVAEAFAEDDGLVEAFSAYPCGAPVVGVQWHPEWNYRDRPEGQAFFRLIGTALAAVTFPSPPPSPR